MVHLELGKERDERMSQLSARIHGSFGAGKERDERMSQLSARIHGSFGA
jgi:hypothetical protein